MALETFRNSGRTAERLGEAIRGDRLSHAYIIEGDALSDKVGFAEGFAAAILCPEKPGVGCGVCPTCRQVEHGSYDDLYHFCKEENHASLRDTVIQQLQKDLLNLPAGRGKRNIAIVEDVDTLTDWAQNRLLKTLEEPLPGTVILLLSENSENLLPTIRSRCVKIRIGGEAAAENPKEKKYRELAEELTEMAVSGAYFYEIKNKLDRQIKDRDAALAFLDAEERLMREIMLEGNAPLMDRSKALACVGYIEEARRDILGNVRHVYAVRNLLLKIGG